MGRPLAIAFRFGVVQLDFVRVEIRKPKRHPAWLDALHSNHEIADHIDNGSDVADFRWPCEAVSSNEAARLFLKSDDSHKVELTKISHGCLGASLADSRDTWGHAGELQATVAHT